ncbi:MAG: hypothetical protein EPO06_07055 [Burkholderiaceae bacterium]|nr:MAG: hypothetical protein EPO06_07055 [Burkholderiaceae bacterium]
MNFRRYNLMVMIFVCSVLGLILGVNSLALRLGKPDPDNTFLLSQLHKAENVGAIDVLFVGDSSLGNAIDAGVWDQTTHTRSINLALTGSYGLSGSLYMINKVLEKRQPKRIYIVQTADIWEREQNLSMNDALKAASRAQSFWFRLADDMTIKGTLRSMRYLSGFFSGQIDRQNIFHKDFVRQATKIDWRDDPEEFRADGMKVAGISENNFKYAQEIVRLCDARQIDCQFAYGPLLDSICSKSTTYFAQVNQKLEKLGAKLVMSQPICLPYEQMGDTNDHIAPESKEAITLEYVRLLHGQNLGEHWKQ